MTDSTTCDLDVSDLLEELVRGFEEVIATVIGRPVAPFPDETPRMTGAAALPEAA